MSEQKKAEEFGITEDDVSEIRQVELETKVKRRFAKISQSRRGPLLVATSCVGVAISSLLSVGSMSV